jgi:hypothetical protein
MSVLCRFAPFYSGGGYCSEAIAFMQALQQTAPPDTLLAIQQVRHRTQMYIIYVNGYTGARERCI